MHDIFSRQPDPLEDMLRPHSPPENEALRQALFVQTQCVLRRRRFVRQFAYAAGLLLSFAAGLLVMRVSAPSGDPGRVSAASKPARTQPYAPARVKEWHAFDSDARRGELYRQAGDAYMEDESDPQSALRCYTNALDDGTEQDLTISPNDNWLLMAIKDARQKENHHAKKGS